MYLLPLLDVMGNQPGWLLNILDDGHEDEVHMGIEGFLEERCHSVIWFAVGWEWWWVSCWGGGFCGAFTLTRLVHVALFSLIVDLDGLSNLTRSKAKDV
jgi:hypothetical protein